MKLMSIVLSAALIFGIAAVAQADLVVMKAPGIEGKAEVFDAKNNTWSLMGQAWIHHEQIYEHPKENRPVKTVFEASANKMDVDLFPSGKNSGGKSSLQSIKSASMKGLVDIIYTNKFIDPSFPEGYVLSVDKIRADSAVYDGLTRKITLLGNVWVQRTDPRVFTEPAVATAQLAIVDLSGPEPAIHMESKPKNTTIDAVPVKKQVTK